MNLDPLERLLETLNLNDAGAADRAFQTYEPFLRKVVRRLLPGQMRARFDSADIVQSVWAGLLDKLGAADWRFPDAAHLRAFLVSVTRNRFLDRLRQYQSAAARQEPDPQGYRAGAVICPQPRPSQVAQAGELWEQMLAVCPAEHHDVLCLRRDGLSVTEVAARTGLHPDGIRRILRMLARKLALAGPPPSAERLAL